MKGSEDKNHYAPYAVNGFEWTRENEGQIERTWGVYYKKKKNRGILIGIPLASFFDYISMVSGRFLLDVH